MPDLETLRKWVAGYNVEGLPKRTGTWDVHKTPEEASMSI